MKDEIALTLRYHEETKHHPHRYARSPGYLDWANEPDPFRRYEGTKLLYLPLNEQDPDADYSDLYRRKHQARPFSLKNLASFLEISLGLSAWKIYGANSWALRTNPSSGNLHPTEAHLILPPLPETADYGGVYHYNPYFHALEQRTSFNRGFWSGIRDYYGMDGFFAGLSSIYWREAWKYGERAFRYCNHDVGHAAACLSFAGNLLGWKITYLNALSDQDMEVLLGFRNTRWRRFEREIPELLFFVHPNSVKDVPVDMPHGIISSFQSLSYIGEPNLLSKDHKDWQIIDEVSAATQKRRTTDVRYLYRDTEYINAGTPHTPAAAVIRKRRSAVAFDGSTTLPKGALLSILDKTIPRRRSAPFDMELSEPSVHLLIFLHRVSGMDPGLYFLVRNEADLADLKQSCRDDFLWEGVDGATGLYLLKRGDFRSAGAEAG